MLGSGRCILLSILYCMKQVSLSFSMFLNKDGFMYKFFDLLLSKLDFIMPIGLAIDLSMLQ